MTAFLTVEQVIELHDLEKQCALIDRGKLEGAVVQCQATWGGEYLYPTLLHQAAALIFCVCNAHAFEDANKRTAWLAGAAFLDANGVDFAEVDQDDVVELMVNIADARWTIEQVLAWLIDRI